MCYCLLFVEFSFAQLTVSVAQPPDSLVRRVLVGRGVIIDSVTVKGAGVQRGKFTDNYNPRIFGFTEPEGFEGVFLSTGRLSQKTDYSGPASSLSSQKIGQPGDADLATIAKTTLNNTYDASVLEFNFIPSSDTVSFRYVFASEEYPGYVGKGYNDVFAFLISTKGPGITNDPGLSGKNIALIPGTNLPVSIDNINNVHTFDAINGYFYDRYKQYYEDNSKGKYFTYNGFTKVLTAVSKVNACQKYHIKLAISDVGDYYWDSGVILEANSFSSSDISRVNGFSKPDISTKYGYKGCSMPYVTFSKPTKEKNVSRTFNISIGGTAKDGIDYNIFDQNATHLINPTSITIPAGEDSVRLLFSLSFTNTTGIPDPDQTIIVKSAISKCDTKTYNDSLTIIVKDNPKLLLTGTGPVTSICKGTSTKLYVKASGGIPPYTYSWENNSGTDTSITVIPQSSKTYNVTVYDNCGGSTSASIPVSVDESFADAGSDQTICNKQSITLNAKGGDKYAWSPGTGLSSTIIANPIASPSDTTIYFVTVTKGACTDIDTVIVNVIQLPQIKAGADVTIGSGQSITLNATGANTYTWLPATGLSSVNIFNPIANPVVTTKYTVSGTDDTAQKCSNTDDIIITVVSASVDAGPPQTICPGKCATLTTTEVNTVTRSWSTGETTQTISVCPVVTCTYYVTAKTNVAGYNAVDSVVVYVSNPTAKAFHDTAYCSGGAVQLNSTGGTKCNWSPATGLSSTVIYNPVASPVASTTYTVTTYNTDNCTATDKVVITVNPLPKIKADSLNKIITICLNGFYPLKASGGSIYKWSPVGTLDDANIANPKATPTSRTTYTVTGTDINGCTGTDQIIIDLGVPKAEAGPDTNVCKGSSQTLTASGGTFYSWSTNEGNVSISVKPSVKTMYKVTAYILDKNCYATDSVWVTPIQTIAKISSDTSEFCVGGIAKLNVAGGNQGATYLWSPSIGLSSSVISNPTATPVQTTTYKVTVDNKGCAGTDQIIITIHQLPIAKISAGKDTIICSGKSAIMTATGGISYIWDNNLNPLSIQTVSPLSNTTYSVIVTDNFGCKSDAKIAISVQTPQIDIGLAPSLCAGQTTAVLNAHPKGGYKYTFKWDPDKSGNSSDTLLINPSSLTTYIVTATIIPGPGCSATSQVIVKPGSASVDAGKDTTICLHTTTTLTATGASTYLWNNSEKSATIHVTPTITTTYIVTAYDKNNCSATDAVVVTTYQPNITVLPVDQTICIGSSTKLKASGGLTYAWSANPVDTVIIRKATDTVTVFPKNSTQYIVTGTDINSCSNTASASVLVDNPMVSFDSPPGVCVDKIATISISGAGISDTCKWNLEGGKIMSSSGTTTINVSWDTNGAKNISLYIIDKYGCKSPNVKDTIVIYSSPVVDFTSSSQRGCPPFTVFFHDSSKTEAFQPNYLWKFGDGHNSILQDPVNTYEKTGKDSVCLTVSAGGCSSTLCKMNYIIIDSVPSADFVASPKEVSVLMPDIRFADLSKGANKIEWILWNSIKRNDKFFVYNFRDLGVGIYNIKLIAYNKYGCRDSIESSIEIKPDYTIYLPNAFTPNDDGQNDLYKAYGWGIQEFEMEIFNKWGQIVFQSNDIKQGWNGRMFNTKEKVQQGLYVCKVTFVDILNKKHEFYSNVTLIYRKQN